MSDIRTKPSNRSYREGWDRVFGKRYNRNDIEWDKKSQEILKKRAETCKKGKIRLISEWNGQKFLYNENMELVKTVHGENTEDPEICKKGKK